MRASCTEVRRSVSSLAFCLYHSACVNRFLGEELEEDVEEDCGNAEANTENEARIKIGVFITNTSRSFDGRRATSFGNRCTTPPNKRESFLQGRILDFKIMDFLLQIGKDSISSGRSTAAPIIGETEKPIGRYSIRSTNLQNGLEVWRANFRAIIVHGLLWNPAE